MTFDWHHLWHQLQPFEYVLSLGLGGAAVAFRRYWQKVKEGRATGWPSADAVIQTATLRRHEGYEVELSYRYYVGQEYRYGKYRRHFREKIRLNCSPSLSGGDPCQCATAKTIPACQC